MTAVVYSKTMSNFNTKAKKKPDAFKEEQWTDFKAYWNHPETKRTSAIKHNNRMTEVDGPNSGCSRHFGGSRLGVGHVLVFENEKGYKPNALDAFLNLSMKEDVSFADPRKKKTYDEFMVRVDELTEAGNEVDTEQIFLQLNPPNKKQRVNGLGSAQPLFVKPSSYSMASSSSTQLQSEEVSERLQQMSEDNAKLRVNFQAERDARLKLEETVATLQTDQQKMLTLEETVTQMRSYMLKSGMVLTLENQAPQ